MTDPRAEPPDPAPSDSGDDDGLDPDSSRGRILRAAVVEFAARGLQGARMEAIARAAGLNKALAYRYFRSKEQLFAAALRSKFARRYGVADRAPEALGDALEYWFRHSSDDPAFLALIHREALNPEQPVAHEALRADYYDAQRKDIERRMAKGQLDPAFDPGMTLLALIALVSFPSFFPLLTRLITGRRADDEGFKRDWARFLRALADRVGPR